MAARMSARSTASGRARPLRIAAGARRGGRVSLLRTGVATVVLAVSLAGCGIAAPNEAAPTPTALPAASLSGSIELARGLVEAALRTANFGLVRPRVPFRPAESPSLAGAPRGVFQVVLGDDPDGGYLVIYELPDPSAAYAAGLEQAAYVASGPGAVQFLPDTRHVLRYVGNVLIFFSWSPENSPDPRTREIAIALESVGQEIPIRR